MHFNGKIFFLVVFFVLLLVGIPAAVWMLQQQQITTQQAAKATILSFDPTSDQGNPITKNVGEDVVLDVMVDPDAKNVVSSINIDIQYDKDILGQPSASGFVVNSAVFNTVLVGPVYTPGKITANLGISDPTKALTVKTKAVTITFKALSATEKGTPTQVTYTVNSRATSRGPQDQALENVLSTSIPAFIAINGGAQPTTAPTNTPAPTSAPRPTTPPVSDGPITAPPDCLALTLDQSSGTAPFTVNFSANGADSDGTVTKATFNFGDGQVSDVTEGFGLGTDTVNAQAPHTYDAVGTFQATALLTDNAGAVSDTANCTQTITVAGDSSASATPVPTVAPSGTTEWLFGLGAASLLLIIGGTLVFFIL